MDSLSVFTFLWAQVAALQLVKLWNEQGMMYWFAFLSVGVIAGLVIPSRGTLPLMVIESVTMLYTGSQSNHVVLSVFVCVAVLTSWNKNKSVWQGQCMNSLRLLTGSLYLITGIHKLNADWFQVRHSCASQMLTGSLAVVHYLPTDFVPLVLIAIPHLAAGLELLLGVVFICAQSELVKLFAVISGSVMHTLMGLPYSPMSVYPFSIIMVPLYISLIPKRVEYMANWAMSHKSLVCACAALVASLAWNLKTILGVENEMLEYPAYSSWSAGVTWNVVMWLMIIFCCFLPVEESRSRYLHAPGVFVAILLFLFGMLPFIGLRTYPAFAMFSNLRTEGNANNHLLIGDQWDLFRYQSDTVEILDSDIPAIRDMQVDLGVFFNNSTKSLLEKYELSSEFYIVPPKWTHSSTLPSRSFQVPLIELRRRLANNKVHGYINYTRGSVNMSYDSSIGDKELEAPLSWFESTLVRFRTFDKTYSPCRH